MVKLSVCTDQFAALRNMTKRGEPDPITAVMMSQISGADAVTITWSNNPSFYLGGEYEIIRQLVHSHLNVITIADLDLLQSILTISPDMVTLVPVGYNHSGTANDPFDASWPEGDSLDKPVERMINALKDNRILTNVLIKPTSTYIRDCANLKSDYVHIDASAYVEAVTPEDKNRVYEEIESAARTASRMSMGVSIGRGIDYRNAAELASIVEIEELVVGYAISVRAMTIGFERAVRDMVDLVRHAPRSGTPW